MLLLRFLNFVHIYDKTSTELNDLKEKSYSSRLWDRSFEYSVWDKLDQSSQTTSSDTTYILFSLN